MTLRRKTPLRRGARGAGLKPLKPINKRNRARFSKGWLHAYGSPERVAWINAHGCVGCAKGPCQNHHVINGGMGKKAAARFIVPLCPTCHRWIHDRGRYAFELAFADRLGGLTLIEWAAHYERAWKGASNPEPLSSIVPRVVADLLDGEDA